MVTGIGVLSPVGIGVEEHWASVLEGRCGITELDRWDASGYPAGRAGLVSGFDPAEHVSPRLIPQTDHMTRMALAAVDEALQDAGRIGTRPEYAMSVATAASAGGYEFGQRELGKLWSQGPGHVSAYQSFAWFYAVNTGQISIRHGMRGPSGVVVADDAGGLDVLAQARRHLRRGSTLVVTGAVDSNVCPWGWVAHLAGGRVSAERYRPFDPDADGSIPAEGGAILVIEPDGDVDGTQVYGCIAGHAATFEGASEAPGSALGRAAEAALKDAGLGPSDVDLVLPDAAGVPALDRAERDALVGLFGRRGVPVAVPKTATGRVSAGTGPLDVVHALLALRDGVVPPAIGLRQPPDDLDLVLDTPRPAALSTALVLARGRGGFHSAVVVTR
ncbi:beta-ketoacyl synthase N-terminal-like domain-containing protein [Pseudonocardia alni]|uniref:beta-ketoacyl synthase N-terminal-like domain-containing protein n=1 Tax=Pseudonocardia alni TaxID=33907 RepID=UPI00386F04CC